MSYIGSTPTTQSFIAGTDYFNGTGAAVSFTMSRAVNSVNDIEVIVNNVEQIPSGYSVSGTTLTFSAAPSAGTSNVYVRYLSTTNLSLAIAAGTSADFNTVAYTGTLTGGTGVVNIGSGQVYKDASGNVGIGTSSPNKSSSSTALAVNTGTAANYSAIEWASGNTLNYHINANNSAIYHVAAGTRPWIVYTNGSERVRIDSSGNVGIGTSAPKSKLHINGASSSPPTSGTTPTGVFQMTTDSAGYSLFAGGYGSGSFSPWIQSQNKNDLSDYGSLILQPNGGNLLVGETAVDSSGGLAVIPGYATGAPAILAFNKGNSANETCLRFKYQGTQVGSISYSNTATAYNTSSDYRLKEAIAPMTGALAKVALLKPCTYKWKVDGSDGQGFIAHELDEVVPGCVTGEKDAVQEEQYEVTPAVKDEEGNTVTEAVMGTRIAPVYQGIDTSFLVATLTAAIQEQQALITALTTRITALENNNATQ